MLNRDDIFVNFTTTSSVALEWAGPADQGIGLWNLLWQVIIAKELARRLDVYPDASISGLTAHGLASLIIADLWLNNLEVVMTDARLSSTALKKADTPEEQKKADDYKEQGNRALAAKQFQQAVDLYTKAMEIDLTNPIYRTNRAVAQLSLDNNTGARNDASIARQLDPRYAKAWHWLGASCLKMDNLKEAIYAYQRALDLSGGNASEAMKQGLADAKAKRESEYQAVEQESSPARKHSLRMKIFEEDWDIDQRHAEFHSLVHERQIEGLLLFAERMKWPYVNEVRDYAEDVYANLRSGKSIQFHLHDWVFGLTLPGKWMAFKIMTALILCTPSITAQVGIARFYECGLVLPHKSYWRARTVLARVLGCLPNVISLCGWIGPCPAVEFQPAALPSEAHRMHIRLKARRVAPIKSASEAEDNVIHIGGSDHYEATRIGPEEEIPAYIADIQDDSHWAIPEPPVRDLSTCTLEAVRLKKMPLDINAAERSADGGLADDETNSEVEYRASLVFKLDHDPQQITYTLYTNPVFVTLPPCHGGPKGPHEVHLRELARFQKNLWGVGDLREHVADTADAQEEEGGGVMIINARGTGCEMLARAWCAERGRNAVIRRTGGPCFVCAYRAASKTSLGVGVLIWVS